MLKGATIGWMPPATEGEGGVPSGELSDDIGR
jgi:hypothetical protein